MLRLIQIKIKYLIYLLQNRSKYVSYAISHSQLVRVLQDTLEMHIEKNYSNVHCVINHLIHLKDILITLKKFIWRNQIVVKNNLNNNHLVLFLKDLSIQNNK